MTGIPNRQISNISSLTNDLWHLMNTGMGHQKWIVHILWWYPPPDKKRTNKCCQFPDPPEGTMIKVIQECSAQEQRRTYETKSYTSTANIEDLPKSNRLIFSYFFILPDFLLCKRVLSELEARNCSESRSGRDLPDLWLLPELWPTFTLPEWCLWGSTLNRKAIQLGFIESCRDENVKRKVGYFDGDWLWIWKSKYCVPIQNPIPQLYNISHCLVWNLY